MIALHLYFAGHCDQTELNYMNMSILWILSEALADARVVTSSTFSVFQNLQYIFNQRL